MMNPTTISRANAALLSVALFACGRTDKPTVDPTTAVTTNDGDAGADDPVADVPPTDTPPVTAAFVPGPGGVPLPADATQRTDMPSAGGKMFVFEIPRSRAAVSEELRANLAADGWTIDSEEVSPRYEALRLKVSKDGATVDARVTGDDATSGIIITVK